MAPDLDGAVNIYEKVIVSFALGLSRLWGAEAASARLDLALMTYLMTPVASPTKHPYRATLEQLAKIPATSADALRYVTDISHLVYSTTLLDTFLTDTTLFLFLLFPQSIGKNQQVPLSSLLATTSRGEIVTEAASKKSREVSYLAFPSRIQFLRDCFGLDIKLTAEVVAALEHFPSIRNSAVHDQGVFQFAVDDAGRLTCRQKSCHLHPTPVLGSDPYDSAKAYAAAANGVVVAVMDQVLKRPEHPALQALATSATKHDYGTLANRRVQRERPRVTPIAEKRKRRATRPRR